MSVVHTPGPWSLGKGYGLHGVEVVGNNGNRMVCGVIGVERDIHDPDGRTTGKAQTPDGWGNARLIVAAPDLLEALQMADEWIREAKNQGCSLPADNTLAMTLAAIAKAVTP